MTSGIIFSKIFWGVCLSQFSSPQPSCVCLHQAAFHTRDHTHGEHIIPLRELLEGKVSCIPHYKGPSESCKLAHIGPWWARRLHWYLQEWEASGTFGFLSKKGMNTYWEWAAHSWRKEEMPISLNRKFNFIVKWEITSTTQQSSWQIQESSNMGLFSLVSSSLWYTKQYL